MGDAPTVVLDARAELGECPVWAAEEAALYCVDIRGAALHRFHPDIGADRVWPLPSPLHRRRSARPQHPAAGRPPDHAVLRRAGPAHALRHVAAPRRAAAELARQPATGGIVALRVDVAGVPVARFGSPARPR
jgi:hypothetical protein